MKHLLFAFSFLLCYLPTVNIAQNPIKIKNLIGVNIDNGEDYLKNYEKFDFFRKSWKKEAITDTTKLLSSVIRISIDTNQNNFDDYGNAAEWATVIAAKYGNSTIPDEAFSFFETRLAKDSLSNQLSLGEIQYLELAYDADEYWQKDLSLLNTGFHKFQTVPNQMATYYHAAYDGGCKSEKFKVAGNKQEYIGIKNYAPDMKVAIESLTGFNGKIMESIIDFAVNNLQRDGLSDKCHKAYLPFDVISFKHHCTTTNAIPENSLLKSFSEGYSEKYPAYKFSHYYETTSKPGPDANELGVSPEEGGLKTYIELTLQRLMKYIDLNHSDKPGLLEEFTSKEIWLSEFGYDTDDSGQSPVRVKEIDGHSLQETQAQWLVRSLLEISAAEAIYEAPSAIRHRMKIHRAIISDYCDNDQSNPTYKRSGLLKADHAPKKSWYHLQTLRNVLGKMEYEREIKNVPLLNMTEVPDFSNNAKIYYYHGDYGNYLHKNILGIWSPNSTGGKGDLILDLKELSSEDYFRGLTIITPRDGDEDGFHKSYAIDGDSFTFDSSTERISETPIYVVLGVEEDEVECPCPKLTISEVNHDSFTVNWEPYTSLGYEKPMTIDIYIKNGDVTELEIDDKDVILVARDAANNGQYEIGTLKAATKYTVFIIFKWGNGAIQICKINQKTKPVSFLRNK